MGDNQTLEIRLDNTTFSGEYKSKHDLGVLNKVVNSKFYKSSSKLQEVLGGSLIVRLQNPKCTVSLFQSGKCTVTGLTNLDVDVVDRELLGDTVTLRNMKLQNIVATADANKNYDCGLLGALLEPNEFKRKKFGGDYYLGKINNGTVRAHTTGKFILTGYKNLESLRSAVNTLSSYLNSDLPEGSVQLICKTDVLDPVIKSFVSMAPTFNADENFEVKLSRDQIDKGKELILKYIPQKNYGGTVGIAPAVMYAVTEKPQRIFIDAFGVADMSLRNCLRDIENVFGNTLNKYGPNYSADLNSLENFNSILNLFIEKAKDNEVPDDLINMGKTIITHYNKHKTYNPSDQAIAATTLWHVSSLSQSEARAEFEIGSAATIYRCLQDMNRAVLDFEKYKYNITN